MWQFAPNSVHYLLSLWQRMVASVPYVKATEPHLLETYTPEVTNAYITSRLESVAVVVREGLEDPIEDLGMVQQQLEQLSVIGRCEYQKTCTLLVQLFDQVVRTYQELITTPSQQIEISIQEGVFVLFYSCDLLLNNMIFRSFNVVSVYNRFSNRWTGYF